MEKIDFTEFLEPMNSGEYEAKKILRRNGLKVTDVSDNPKYWDKDIDLLVDCESGQLSIEVKWDNHIAETNNLFLEVYCEHSKNNKGWFNFCQADYLFYGDAKNEVFYVFWVEDLKEFMEENKKRFKLFRYTERKPNGAREYTTQGYLVPLSKVQHLLVKKLEYRN